VSVIVQASALCSWPRGIFHSAGKCGAGAPGQRVYRHSFARTL